MAKALPLKVVQSGLESSIDQVRDKVKPIVVPVNVDPSAFKNLAQPLGRVSGLATEFEKSIAASNARVLAFGASVGIINGVQNAFASLLRTGIEVQKILAEIGVISGRSGEDLSKFGDSLFEIGKLTGQSFKTAAQAALEFSRQGLSTEETLKRTSDALTLTRFTTLNAAEAVDVLTAAANSFGDTGITTAEILNKLVAVDTKFAVSAEDLANGLARAGSIAQEVGVSFDELNAAITIAQERTARGGSVIGNALKTIFTRLRSDETVQALRSIGVESLNAQGGLKGAIPLLEEVAQKLQGLSEGERVQILEAIASKYNINILSAILTDLSDANKKFGEVVAISAGAGNQAYERQVELNKALAIQINVTTVSVEQLFNKLAEIGVTESLANLLKFVNGLLDGINKILDSESTGGNIARGLIKGISDVFFTVGLPLLGAIFIKLTKDIAQFGVESLKTILGINQQVRERQALEQAVVNTLIRDQEIMATILSYTGDRRKQEEYLLGVYNKQLAALQQVQSIAAGVAPALQGAGLSATSGTVKRRAAGGYLPDAEARDVRRGVGGASPSSKVVEIPNFSFGGGKRGTMVANTSEYIVPNYAGGSGAAIFNQDMVKQYGLPPGAKKITASGGFVPASGFVPNFAEKKPKGIGGLQGMELAYDFEKYVESTEKDLKTRGKKAPYILAGRIFESRAQGLRSIDLQENEEKADIQNGNYAISEAKLSLSAGADDPQLSKGGLKGDSLLVPKTAIEDEASKKKLSKKGVSVIRKHESLTHDDLFGEARKIIKKYKRTPRDEIPTPIPLLNASQGYIPNFANMGYIHTGIGPMYKGRRIVEGNAMRAKEFLALRDQGSYREATFEEMQDYTAQVAQKMNENISVTAQHPLGAVMLLPRQEQAAAVNKDSQGFGVKPKDALTTTEGEGINFVKFAAFGVNDEKFKSKSGAKMSDIQMRIKKAIGSIGADVTNDFKVLTKETLDTDGFYKLFDKKQGAAGSVSAVAGSIFEAATDYTLNPAGNPDFSDPDTSFDVGSLTPNLIDVFDIKDKNYGPGTKADFKISEDRARAFANQIVLNKVYKKIDKTTGLTKAAKGYIPNFAGKYFYDPNLILKEDDVTKGEDGKDIKNATLKKVLASRKKINVLIGPVGSGKTALAQASGGVFLRKPSDVDLAEEITILQTSHTSTKTGGISDNMRQILDAATGQISYLDVSDEIITERRKARSAQAEAGAIVGDTRSAKQIVSGDQFAEKRSPVFVQAVQDYLKTKGKTLNMVKGADGYIPNFASQNAIDAMRRIVSDPAAPQGEKDAAASKLAQLTKVTSSRNPRATTQKTVKTKLRISEEDKAYLNQNKEKIVAGMGRSFGMLFNLDALEMGDINYVKRLDPIIAKKLSEIAQKQGGRDSIRSLIDFGSAARGYIPNFADNEPLKEAISREIGAGVSPARVRVTRDGRLRNAENPNGLAVINTRDEPNGKIPNDFRERGMRAAMASRGFVPNFADVSKKQIKDLLGKSPNPKNPEIYTGGQDFDYGVKAEAKVENAGKAQTELDKLSESAKKASEAADKQAKSGSSLDATILKSTAVFGALTSASYILQESLAKTDSGILLFTKGITDAAQKASLGLTLGEGFKPVLDIIGDKLPGTMGKFVSNLSGAVPVIGAVSGALFGLAEFLQELTEKDKKTGEQRATKFIENAQVLDTKTSIGLVEKRIQELENRTPLADLNRRKETARVITSTMFGGAGSGGFGYQGGPMTEAEKKEEEESQKALGERTKLEEFLKKLKEKAQTEQERATSQQQKENEEVRKRISLSESLAAINEGFAAGQNKTLIERASKQALLLSLSYKLTESQKTEQELQQKLQNIENQRLDLKNELFNRALNEISNSSKLANVDKESVKNLVKRVKEGEKIENLQAEFAKLGIEGALVAEEILKKTSSTLKIEDGKLQTQKLTTEQIERATIALSNQLRIEELRSKILDDNFKSNRDIEDSILRSTRAVDEAKLKTPVAILENRIASQPFATREQEYELARLKDQFEKLSAQRKIDIDFAETQRNSFNKLQDSITASIDGLKDLDKGFKDQSKEIIRNATSVEQVRSVLEDLIEARKSFAATQGIDSKAVVELDLAIQNIKNSFSAQNIEVENARQLQEEYNKQLQRSVNFQLKLLELRKENPFAAGILAATNELKQEVQGFDEKLGKEMTLGFRDGLRDALGAAISQTDDLNAALQNVATNFLKRMQDLFLQDAANNLTLGIKNGLSNAFSNNSGASAQSGLSSVFKSIGNFFSSGTNTPRAAVLSKGGYIKGYATGGLVTGGSGYRDDVPAMLSEGEYVIRKSSVNKYGASNLSRLNSGEAPKFAAGGIFLPGVRGATAISGYKDLTAFANQTTTSGLTDVLMGGKSTAFANLEDQSVRLSRFALLNEDDIVNQEIRSAQEQALNIMAEREAYRTAQRKAFQKQLKQTAISAALNFGLGQLGSMASSAASAGKGSATGLNLMSQAPGKTQFLTNTKAFSMPSIPSFNYSFQPRGAYGGIINRYNSGGAPTDDVPALLMGGEYVMSRKATKKYGKQFFDSINQGRAPRFADGGQVSTSEPSFAEKAASSAESKSSNTSNVTININVTGGTSETKTEGDTKQGSTDYKKMGEQIKQIVIQTINEEKRLGGSLRPRG